MGLCLGMTRTDSSRTDSSSSMHPSNMYWTMALAETSFCWQQPEGEMREQLDWLTNDKNNAERMTMRQSVATRAAKGR